MDSTFSLSQKQETTINTEEFFKEVLNDPTYYEKYQVNRITHVKNLLSRVTHEYLQIIVEDTETKRCTRVIAERQDDQDQVIVGRTLWYTKTLPAVVAAFTEKTGDILPLPLCTITPQRESKLIDLAAILYGVTRCAPNYRLLNENCYWFASWAYRALRITFHGQEQC
jgi:phosphotransacetylase